MNHDMPAYGLWSMVIINSLVFILFALHFLAPAAGGCNTDAVICVGPVLEESRAGSFVNLTTGLHW